jgi:hypothetical protein
VVGYYNVEVKASKFSMVALNMSSVDGGKKTLDELFPFNSNMTASTTAGGSDQIRIWDYEAQSYRYFFMYNNAFMATNPKNKKWVENVTGNPLSEDVLLGAGDAVFYYAKSKDNTFSIPGQVPAEAAGTLKSGFNMIGVGFPSEWCPNDAGTDFWKDAKFAKSTTAGGADQIQYWDDAKQTYRYFFLYNNAFMPTNEKNNKWVENVTGNPILTEKLSTGAGFFYYRKNTGDVEFKPGLAL